MTPEVVLCDAERENSALREVVVEVVHPTLRFGEWRERYLAHTANGVAEYYLIHPGPPMDVEVWCRSGDQLAPVHKRHGFVSPRLGLRFVLETGELTIFGRDGHPLRTLAEMAVERDEAERQAAKLVAKLRELGVDPEGV